MGNESLASNLNIPQNQFKYTPWGTIDDYYRFWSPIEVALIPMLDTAYNECRSDIKIIETIAHGVLPIVPDLLPYKQLISKFNLPSYSDHISLKNILKQTVELSDSSRNNILKPAFDWIVNHRTHSTCFDRKKIYEKYTSECFNNDNSKFTSGYTFVKSVDSSVKPEPIYITELKKIQAIQKSGNHQIAMEQLTRLHSESPSHPEITLSYLHQLLQTDFDYGYKLLKEYALLFSKDIRYQVMLITNAKTDVDKISCLRNLLVFIRSQSTNYINAVRPNIANVVISILKQSSNRLSEELFNICEEFLLLYPYSYSVRFTIAELYQKYGYHKEARGHFIALEQAKRQYDQGFSEITGLDYGYLAAWREACDKRVKGKLR
jgi:hypothetical protein